MENTVSPSIGTLLTVGQIIAELVQVAQSGTVAQNTHTSWHFSHTHTSRSVCIENLYMGDSSAGN